MKRTVSLFIMVAFLFAGVTFSVFGQYDPDDSTTSTASDHLQLSPESAGVTTVNTDQWIGVFRDGGAGASGSPVALDDGSAADTTYLLDDTTSLPGDGSTSTSSGGTTGTTTSSDGMLRYSVLYQSGTQFDISVSAASNPTSSVEVAVLGLDTSSNAVGTIGSIVADGANPVTLSGTDQTIINNIGGNTTNTDPDFVANDGSDDYFEAYTGTGDSSDGANIQYEVTSFAGSVEDIQVTYTIAVQ